MLNLAIFKNTRKAAPSFLWVQKATDDGLRHWAIL